MVGRPSGDRSIDPAELLRGALEKIVFFECRVSQLESELRAAIQTAERARTDASAAHQKAVGLEEAVAVARGARVESDRMAGELSDRVRLLEAERERLLSGLVEQARLAGAPGVEGAEAGEQADLAGFIAELRGEIESLRNFKASVTAGGASAPGALSAAQAEERRTAHASVGAIGGALAANGRASLTARDAGALRGTLTTESDRLLFEEAVERLRAADPSVRLGAVRRLDALDPRAAAPLLGVAVGREPDEGVKVALLGALARVKEPFAAELVAGAMQDRRPAVRAAALDALSRLAPDRAEPCAITSLGDESPIVRRRAALLLGYARSTQADEALAAALRDVDAGVARAAAAALAGRPSAPAQGALTRALEHGDARVRRSAAETLGRWSGERVDGDAPLHERRRAARRISEKLAAMAPAEVRSAVLGVAERERTRTPELRVHRFTRQGVLQAGLWPSPPRAPAARPVAAKPAPRATVTAAPAARAATAAGPVSAVARTAVAVVAAPSSRFSPDGLGEKGDPGAGPEGLSDAIVAELRGALRGRSTPELIGLLAAPPSELEAALNGLVSRGAVVARGPRWYVG